MALTFAPIDGSPVDDYTVTLDEVTNASGVTKLTVLRSYSVRAPSVDVDPALLVAGHSYLFQLVARLGFPGAANRDYSLIGYPYATSTTYTGIFYVQS